MDKKQSNEEHPSIIKQKGLENLILLIIGASDRPISHLHLQKETFLLWNFHPYMKDFLDFIEHYRGPFSSEVRKIIIHPLYLDGCWNYTPPKKQDELSGGYVKITPKGKEIYNKLFQNAKKNESLSVLLSGIGIIRELYDKLSLEELLLLIYDTYPEYKLKSNVSDSIFKKKDVLAKGIYKKGFIDNERMGSLISGSVDE
ncbi:MAG: hypothetical protein IBX39_08290 [Candidatus Methanoperedenaceae archaeon]|nr:hypothetical protein [Candidatus Methanoperedenaceae archaeon]